MSTRIIHPPENWSVDEESTQRKRKQQRQMLNATLEELDVEGRHLDPVVFFIDVSLFILGPGTHKTYSG